MPASLQEIAKAILASGAGEGWTLTVQTDIVDQLKKIAKAIFLSSKLEI